MLNSILNTSQQQRKNQQNITTTSKGESATLSTTSLPYNLGGEASQSAVSSSMVEGKAALFDESLERNERGEQETGGGEKGERREKSSDEDEGNGYYDSEDNVQDDDLCGCGSVECPVCRNDKERMEKNGKLKIDERRKQSSGSQEELQKTKKGGERERNSGGGSESGIGGKGAAKTVRDVVDSDTHYTLDSNVDMSESGEMNESDEDDDIYSGGYVDDGDTDDDDGDDNDDDGGGGGGGAGGGGGGGDNVCNADNNQCSIEGAHIAGHDRGEVEEPLSWSESFARVFHMPLNARYTFLLQLYQSFVQVAEDIGHTIIR